MERDFEAEARSLEQELVTGVRWQAVHGLCALEEEWARHLLGVGGGSIEKVVRARVHAALAADIADRAAQHLAAAERWQWEIGGGATGAGEGLASMGSVYRLKMAQAWLAGALARITGDSAYARNAALLVAEVERDPNGLGAVHAAAIEELRAWSLALASPESPA